MQYLPFESWARGTAIGSALAMSKVVPVEAGETADEKPPPLKPEASFITSDALSGLSPKVGPGGFLLVFLSVFAPSLLFCAVFSVMGYGHIVYDILVRLGSRTVAGRPLYASGCAAAFMLICLLMYIFDASYWKGAALVLRTLIFVVAGVLFGVACVLATSAIPYMPMMFGLMVRALSRASPRELRALIPIPPSSRSACRSSSSSCARRCCRR